MEQQCTCTSIYVLECLYMILRMASVATQEYLRGTGKHAHAVRYTRRSNEREVCHVWCTKRLPGVWTRTACGLSRATRTGRLLPRPATPLLTTRRTPAIDGL